MKARLSTEAARRALKTASRVIVELCGGGKQAATLTDVDETTLSLYLAPHEAKRFMRIDVALDLDLAAGEPVMARALASAQGFDLVRLDQPAGDVQPKRLSLADYGRLQRQAFEAQACVFESLEDGAICPAEKREILQELAELPRAISAVETKVAAA